MKKSIRINSCFYNRIECRTEAGLRQPHSNILSIGPTTFQNTLAPAYVCMHDRQSLAGAGKNVHEFAIKISKKNYIYILY